MKKAEIEKEIAEYEALLKDSTVPQDEKDFAKDEIADLKKKLEKLDGKPETGKGATKGPKPPKVKKSKAKANENIITFSDGYKWKVVSKAYAEKNFEKESIYKIYEEDQSEALIQYDTDLTDPEAVYAIPLGKKATTKSGKRVKTKQAVTFKYKDKDVKTLTEQECEDLKKEVRERRQNQKKAEKKSKSKPVIEKIAKNVATSVKQAIKNVSAADIKDDPKGELDKMAKVEKLAKKFLSDLRAILGDDYDKEAIDGEFKEVHDLIKGLKTKYQ